MSEFKASGLVPSPEYPPRACSDCAGLRAVLAMALDRIDELERARAGWEATARQELDRRNQAIQERDAALDEVERLRNGIIRLIETLEDRDVDDFARRHRALLDGDGA